MTTMLWWLVQNTITIAILAAVVAMLCRALSKRPALQHLLWLVVLIKFVTPPLVMWPWTARGLAEKLHRSAGGTHADSDLHESQPATPSPSFERLTSLTPVDLPVNVPGSSERLPLSNQSDLSSEELIVKNQEPLPVSETLAGQAVLHHSETFAPSSTISTDSQSAGRRLADDVKAGDTQETRIARTRVLSIIEHWKFGVFLPFLFCVWILGSFVFAVAQCRRIVRHWQLVRRATAAPAHLTVEVGRFSKALELRPPSTFIARGIASPFVWCVGSLRLLWPESLASPMEVSRCRGVIAHELAHVLRRDPWVAWLEFSASLIWWWNPLFWYVRRRLRESAEIACDAVALSVLPDERRQYAEAFLAFSSIGKSSEPVPALGVSAGSHRTFERRLRMILTESVVPMVSRRGLVAVGMLALVTLPSWSLGQAPEGAPELKSSRSDESTTSPATKLSDRVKSVANRLEQLNAVGLALDAERAERTTKVRTSAVYDAGTFQLNRMPEKMQQVRMDFREMRTGGRLDPPRIAQAQRVLAELRRFEQAMNATPQEIMIAEVFQHVLQRQPTPEELGTWQKQTKDGSPDAKSYDDLLWALLNSDEFLQDSVPAAEVVAAGQNDSLNKPTDGESENEPREKSTLESRVQQLEGKLDAILQELRNLRTTGGLHRAAPVDVSGPPKLPEARAASPDGKLSVIASNGVIVMVDQATGKALYRTQAFGPSDAIELVVFSPDGKQLVVRTADSVVELDAATGKIIQKHARDDQEGRESQSQASATEVRVFALKYSQAHELATMLEQLVIANVKIAANRNTNSLVVNGPDRQLATIAALIAKLDQPTGEATPQPNFRISAQQQNELAPPARDGHTADPYSKPGSHLDLVRLGTSIIEARGELRLAQSQHARINAVGANSAVSREELDSAAIKLEVAQQKVNLLARFAQSACNAAKAEVQAAKSNVEFANKMGAKGYISATQFEQAKARFLDAEANLQVIESILSPPAADPKANTP